MMTRRQLFTGTAAAAGAVALSRVPALGQELDAATERSYPNAPQSENGEPIWMRAPHPEPGEPGKHYKPVVTLNGSTMPWKLVDGVKVIHMTCDEVWHEFVPKTSSNEALRAQCWGYNKQVHGPTIEAVEGDRLRIYVTNNLPAPTSVHWHGIILPNGMDGVGGLTQKAIQPGETFKYEFTLWQQGTFMYHSHHDEMTQMALGMLGVIVIHPREPKGPPIDRDFVYMLSEWRIDPGTSRPNPVEMTDFNILTLNAKAYPGTAPMIIQKGDRVRIRIGNLSAMDHHPIHFHGHKWWVTETDGGVVPETARWPETTVLVPVGTTRTVEWIANNPGDWAFHCHMTHHVMNQMGHQIPNMIGVKNGNFDQRVRKFLPGYMTMGETGMAEMGDMGMKIPRNSVPMVGAPGPHDYITMGGMYTNIKIREKIDDYNVDPGWYQQPAGTMATLALEEDLRRDGINPAAQSETSVKFVCPMHPEVVSSKPGKCPKCGMALKRSGLSSAPPAHKH
ncbi:MAG: multicopper oxidase protein [Chthoniobacteraceae bacterium]|nr:multicopper oxidase protein [Chthoniobacteraceae bacterium]